MKAFYESAQRIRRTFFIVSAAIISCYLLLINNSCQKLQEDFPSSEILNEVDINPAFELLAFNSPSAVSKIYFGPKRFERQRGAPFKETQTIKNKNFDCFNNDFVLKIRNGRNKETRVSSAEIKINGVLVAAPSDFSKNISCITKPLSGLTPESVLEVKLNSTPGSFIYLWIEGTSNQVTPFFSQIEPLCQNSTPPQLPASSMNTPAITGSWNPATINTSALGKTTYTFTPDEGQCSHPATMEIELIANVTPLFTQIGPVPQGAEAPSLPDGSVNGIAGSWSPASINTTSAGTFTFTFTPSPGLCAVTTSMDIVVTSKENVADIDGNLYNTIRIGEQWWMAENLKTTRYNNGEYIGTTIPATLNISAEIEPKYQWAYSGDETKVGTYGRLYTWYAVTDSRGVCPVGWHLPTDAEWKSLADYLINNGYGFEGSGTDIAKSLAGKSGWQTNPNPGNPGNDQESNNSSGFTALPSGYRNSTVGGSFVLIGYYASWWSATENSVTDVWFRYLQYDLNSMRRNASNKKQGGAVRCVNDN